MLLRKQLNLLLRTFRITKQRVLPNLQLSRLMVLRKLRAQLMTMSRLNYVENVVGHRMYLDEADSLQLSHNLVYEAFETSFFQSELQPGQVIIDIGANIGYYTLIFARQVGAEGHIYAFEPEPENFALLQKNVALNNYHNLTLINKAVADQAGTLNLYLSPTNKGDHRAYDSHDNRTCIAIEAVRLDDYLETFNRPIDYIKMDIQGAEYTALLGMLKLLQRNERVCLITEFWPDGLRRAGTEPQVMLNQLLSLGFQMYHIDDEQKLIEPITSEELLNGSLFVQRRHTNLMFRRTPYTSAFGRAKP